MTEKFRYFLHMAYNGSRYLGWQIQRQSPTVQETVNQALSTILRSEINVVGCGRTDTGVHARNFYAHFDLEQKIDSANKKAVLRKLNGFLPKDIVFFDLKPVQNEANARFDALSRTYKYEVLLNKDPFKTNAAYAYFSPLDVEKMNEGASILFDYIDFTSFSKVNTQVKTNNCIIKKAEWEADGNLLVFTITADRFLRNMVRAIVGTLLDLGKGKMSINQLRDVIESKDRSAAGYSVPAHGLYLQNVEYPGSIFKQEA